MNEAFNMGDIDVAPQNESLDNQDRVPEFDFENGVDESINRIVDILKKQPKVVVAISGSSSNVGKTTLSKYIATGLHDRGIQARTYMGIEEVYDRDLQDNDSVFIFQQAHLGTVNNNIVEKLKDIYNTDIVDAFKEKDVDVKGIDFWIGIYRPDRPFASDVIVNSNSKPLADILIKNDLASNKPI